MCFYYPMKIHRFYIEQDLQKGQAVTIEGDLAHQIRRVLRLAPGEQTVLFNGDGREYSGAIIDFVDEGVRVSVNECALSNNIPKKNITLAISIPKKDTFEWILEKGTELGVKGFIPLLSDRSEKKDINTERAKKIIIEASEQSGRADVPTVSEVIKLSDVVKNSSGKMIAFHTSGSAFDAKEVGDDYTLLIGPEGGWSERDLAYFAEQNIPIRCLGPQVLRVETAAIAISSLLLL